MIRNVLFYALVIVTSYQFFIVISAEASGNFQEAIYEILWFFFLIWSLTRADTSK
jgi:hypothetical protein